MIIVNIIFHQVYIYGGSNHNIEYTIHIDQIDNIQCNDNRFLLVTKYFLKYLLHASNIKIDGTLDPDKCVICVMGSKQRIIQLPKNITNQNDDIVHEVEFLKTRLKEDDKNDLTISIPASSKGDDA